MNNLFGIHIWRRDDSKSPRRITRCRFGSGCQWAGRNRVVIAGLSSYYWALFYYWRSAETWLELVKKGSRDRGREETSHGDSPLLLTHTHVTYTGRDGRCLCKYWHETPALIRRSQIMDQNPRSRTNRRSRATTFPIEARQIIFLYLSTGGISAIVF